MPEPAKDQLNRWEALGTFLIISLQKWEALGTFLIISLQKVRSQEGFHIDPRKATVPWRHWILC
jgi:hypothetical protein